MVVAWASVPPSSTWLPLRLRPLAAVVLSLVGRAALPRLPLASAVTMRVPVAVRLWMRAVPATSSLAVGAVLPVPMPTLPELAMLRRLLKPVKKSSPFWLPLLVRFEPMPSPLPLLPKRMRLVQPAAVPSKLLPASTPRPPATSSLVLGELVPTPTLPVPVMLRLLPPLAMVVALLSVPPSVTLVPVRVRPLLAVVLSPVGAVVVLSAPLASAVTKRVPLPARLATVTVPPLRPMVTLPAVAPVPMLVAAEPLVLMLVVPVRPMVEPATLVVALLLPRLVVPEPVPRLRLLAPLVVLMVVAWASVPPSSTWLPLRLRPLAAVVLSPVGVVLVLRLPLASAVTMRVPVPPRLSRRTLLVPLVPATCRRTAGEE